MGKLKAKNKKTLLYIALGGASLYLISQSMNGGSSSSTSDPTYGPPSPGESFLDSLSSIVSTVTDTVGKITGSLQDNFVATMTPIAQTMQQKYGLDPLIVMTQAALESGWGASGLTKKANNLYGYTGDAALNAWLSSKGLSTSTDMESILAMDLSSAPFIIMQTHEEVSDSPHQYFSRPGDLVSQSGTDAMVWRPFRKYDSWQSSVEDWVQLLKGSRYANAWHDAQAGDLQSFSNDVYAAGYATESDYPVQLVSVGDEIAGIQSA